MKVAVNFALLLIGICISQYSHGQAVLKDSILTDKDGNRYGVSKMADGKKWMTSNLKLKLQNSYCYNNDTGNCEKYGRLYTWESAQRGCEMFKHGWRLPSMDEWQELTLVAGGEGKDSSELRRLAYNSLVAGGKSNFNAQLGGGRDQNGGFARVDAHGFYWSVTEADNSSAWYANFAKGSGALYRQFGGEKARAFSVRCVKD